MLHEEDPRSGFGQNNQIFGLTLPRALNKRTEVSSFDHRLYTRAPMSVRTFCAIKFSFG
jgi:hypothetical protein